MAGSGLDHAGLGIEVAESQLGSEGVVCICHFTSPFGRGSGFSLPYTFIIQALLVGSRAFRQISGFSHESAKPTNEQESIYS